MARLNQALLNKVAKKLGKSPQYIREQVSRRASREGVVSPAALVMWARDLGIGVSSAVDKLPPHVQQQLSVPRVSSARAPTRGTTTARGKGARRGLAKKRKSVRRVRGHWLFISHASDDKQLAKALVELLRSALDVPAEEILCTSVDGYRLGGGDDTDDTLRAEVLQARVLLGIITPSSQKSSYVLFELGARWGTNRPLIPVTAKGANPGDLGGPLAGKNALDCAKRSGVQQLLGDLGTALRMEVERPEVYDEQLNRVVRCAKPTAGKRKKRSSFGTRRKK